MKATKRLISLFAGMLFATTMMANVVYEPLEVVSGFNRDVIAEAMPVATHAEPTIDTCYRTANSCFATKSVIRTVINQKQTSTPGCYSEEELISVPENGFPEDNGNPTDRIISCVEDASGVALYKDVKFHLAPYTEKNALCLRPDAGNQPTGVLKFKKVGCYNRLYFLFVSLKEFGPKTGRTINVKVYYTNGDSTSTTFNFGGLSGDVGHNFCRTNIWEYGNQFKKNAPTSCYADKNDAYACIFDITLDYTKLVDRIWFQNPKEGSAAIILGVAGRTADIDAPAEESTEVENIQNHQFTISWDGVPEAETYRVDVATDEDFQNMVGDYNNLEVSKNDTVVYGLEEDEDYYWRVRAVNADGGQSASSAPRRVRTAGNNPPETSETSENIEEMLAGYAGYRAVVPQLKIHRSLCRNGYFNTLCLPFSMNAEQIAASPLAGIRVFEYVSAEKHDGLDIVISGPIDHIDAGVPYLVNWEPTSPEWIGEDGLVFENVNITTYKGDTIGNNDEVQFIGNIGIANLVELDQNNLFLGANNTLYYPEGGNRLKGFRSYFEIPSSGAQAVARHTPARIVTRKETPTDLDHVQRDNVPCTKVLRNGQLIILRDGKRYNVLGVEL